MNFEDIRTFALSVVAGLGLLVVGMFIRSARVHGRLRRDGARKRKEFEAKYQARQKSKPQPTYMGGSRTTKVTSHHAAAKDSQTKWRSI